MYLTVETLSYAKEEHDASNAFTFSSWLIVYSTTNWRFKNFQKVVDVLSQVWKKTVIDGYLVYWRAVPVGKAYKPPNPDPVWVEIDSAWVQIVKCQDKLCCSPFETNWLKTIPQSFIPFPAIYEYSENDYKAMEPSRYLKNLSKHSNFAPLTHRLLIQDIPI